MRVEVIAFIVGVVLLAVGLAVSIALHELGHLLPAKKFGVRVGQYMIGFGPTVWSTRIGETEYGVKALPLGGYISMAGMYPPSPKEQEPELALAGAETAAGTAGSAGSAGAGTTGRAGGGFFATMVQDARAANDETLQGRDDERVFYRLPVWKRVVIMLGGPVMNLLFAMVLFAILLTGIGQQAATTTVASVSACVPAADAAECAASDPASPAVQAGVQPGDVLVSVAGTPIEDFAQARTLFRGAPGETLDVVVERDGVAQTLRLTPATAVRQDVDEDGVPLTDADGGPVMTEVGVAGITPEVAYVREPIWAGPQAAIENVGAVAGIVWQLPVKVYQTAESLFTGAERDPNSPLSIVGAGVIAGEVAASEAPVLNRVAGLIALLGSLNIALFVFNLLPLLPLDGGHVAVALWEGIKRVWAKLFRRPPPTPVDATKLVPVTFIVVVALIAMTAILVIADLVNPVSLL